MTLIYEQGTSTAAELTQVTNRIWDELRTDERARKAAADQGVDLGKLDLTVTSPYQFTQRAAGAGIVEGAIQLLIVLKDPAIHAGLVVLLERYIAPKIEALLGFGALGKKRSEGDGA